MTREQRKIAMIEQLFRNQEERNRRRLEKQQRRFLAQSVSPPQYLSRREVAQNGPREQARRGKGKATGLRNGRSSAEEETKHDENPTTPQLATSGKSVVEQGAKFDFSANFGKDDWLGAYQKAEIERNKRTCRESGEFGQRLGVAVVPGKDISEKKGVAAENVQMLKEGTQPENEKAAADQQKELELCGNLRDKFIKISKLRKAIIKL